jgi:regulator of protease activity HflC (stomatin/prohibitin superfamily)
MSTDLVLALGALVLVGMGVRGVPEHERLAVRRRGRFIGIRGPGLVWILPFVDKGVRVNLEREVPGWRSLSTEQLTKEIERRLGAAAR